MPAQPDADNFLEQLDRVHELIKQRVTDLASLPTTSDEAQVERSLAGLPASLPVAGLGLAATTDLLIDKVAPGLAPAQAGPRYFGLVIGGVLPSAQIADSLVTSFDACVQIHNPTESIATIIEAKALEFALDLLSLPRDKFTSNTFTTGATASNLLGLALGRDFVIDSIHARAGRRGADGAPWRASEDGAGGVQVEVVSAGAHASVTKVCSLVGLGRRCVSEVGVGPCLVDFDLVALEDKLKQNSEQKKGSIVVLTYGEVNTGAFASQTVQVRALCDRYGGWLHIDAAFGAFGLLLPEFAHLSPDLALADSICVDGHKWLNVPYDCGLFFSRGDSLFASVGPGAKPASYLAATQVVVKEESATPNLDRYRGLYSPLFVNIENSRRFRALPVYASLLALGENGYRDLFATNVDFARRVAEWMRTDGRLEVLTPTEGEDGFHLLNVVLFAPGPNAPARFQGAGGAAALREEINSTKLAHVTGTVWKGRPANRLAVSNWATEWERDGVIVVGVLSKLLGRDQ